MRRIAKFHKVSPAQFAKDWKDTFPTADEKEILSVYENIRLPLRATAGSAGYDLYAALEAPVSIPVGEIVRIPTGIAAAPDRKDVALFIMARSGLASKHGINLANGVGLVDSDYRGELLVPLMNFGKEPFSVEPGMRIAQLVVLPVLFPTCTVVEQLPETERGSNGFGSTGAF